MIIFKLILTTFKSSAIFRGSCGRGIIWLEPYIKPLQANLACTNPQNAL